MTSLYEQMLIDPMKCMDFPYYDGFLLTEAQRDEIQLAGIKRRFGEMQGKVKALDRMVVEQSIRSIDDIDEVVPLFLPHTAYKSYPLSFLERNRFDALTRWLDGLTALDLSKVDASGVTLIDDWLTLLQQQTDLKINHTFGTTGKLSFIPRTSQEWDNGLIMSGHGLRDWRGPNTGPDVMRNHLPMIAPTYRYGFSTTARALDSMVKLYAGGDDNAYFLYPDGMVSADIASLAGRLHAAAARGAQGELELSQSLLDRRAEYAQQEQDRPRAMKDFLAMVAERFGGQDIFLFGMWPLVHDWAEEGLAHGVRKLFGPNSVLLTGGGTKGRTFSDGWRERIFDYLGFNNNYDTFGMSEMTTGALKCDQGNYHFPPITVAYVLDVETGKPLPRKGVQTGRLAIFDIAAETYWGGLLTGDLVNMGGFDEPCACGRHGPYMEPDIRRISDLQGGEDKISCAGAPDAHAKAVEFLVAQSEA